MLALALRGPTQNLMDCIPRKGAHLNVYGLGGAAGGRRIAPGPLEQSADRPGAGRGRDGAPVVRQMSVATLGEDWSRSLRVISSCRRPGGPCGTGAAKPCLNNVSKKAEAERKAKSNVGFWLGGADVAMTSQRRALMLKGEIWLSRYAEELARREAVRWGGRRAGGARFSRLERRGSLLQIESCARASVLHVLAERSARRAARLGSRRRLDHLHRARPRASSRLKGARRKRGGDAVEGG